MRSHSNRTGDGEPVFNLRNLKVGVIGLGYVGLPLEA
jgi:hypothetical protein